MLEPTYPKPLFRKACTAGKETHSQDEYYMSIRLTLEASLTKQALT
jgi:hypothetical protein